MLSLGRRGLPYVACIPNEPSIQPRQADLIGERIRTDTLAPALKPLFNANGRKLDGLRWMSFQSTVARIVIDSIFLV